MSLNPHSKLSSNLHIKLPFYNKRAQSDSVMCSRLPRMELGSECISSSKSRTIAHSLIYSVKQFVFIHVGVDLRH